MLIDVQMSNKKSTNRLQVELIEAWSGQSSSLSRNNQTTCQQDRNALESLLSMFMRLRHPSHRDHTFLVRKGWSLAQDYQAIGGCGSRLQ